MADQVHLNHQFKFSSTETTPKTRGFAAMDQSRQREIASMGGKAAHKSGNAHQFTPEEARKAGTKGGRASQRSARAEAE